VALDSEFKINAAERLAATLQQMNSVEAIIGALRSQIDDEQAFAAAVARATAKRKNKE
jgi:hypothetical protein